MYAEQFPGAQFPGGYPRPMLIQPATPGAMPEYRYAMPIYAAPPPAAEADEQAAAASIPTEAVAASEATATGTAAAPTFASAARVAAEAAAKQHKERSSSSPQTTKKKPPFHTYGRANIKPSVGGFMYGDYMATHNAKAGESIPLTKRPTAAECGGAQVHFMEADLRRSVDYDPSRYSSVGRPRSALASSATATAAEVSADGADEKAAAAVAAASQDYETAVTYASTPPYATMPTAPRPAAATNAPPTAVELSDPEPLAPMAIPSPPTMALDHYAALPAYTPAAYASPPPGMPVLPHYVPPAGGPPPTMPPPAPPPQPAQWVPFVPDAIGERLDPRRFKFAPRAVMASVMPAGKRSVRTDNLGHL